MDHDHACDIGDLTRMIGYLFRGDSPILPKLVGDMTGDCSIDIGDITKLIDYLFISCTPPGVGCE